MPPFQHESVLVPPRRASTTKYGPVEQSNPLSLSAPAGCRRSYATCPQSRQSWRFSRTRTRNTLPWLPQTSTPRRQASFSIILEAGLGLSDVVFSCGIKKDVSREKSWAPLIRRVDPPLANALPRLLDAFLDARSRSKRVHRVCAALRTQMLVLNDPPERVMEAQL